jgi:acyl-CoA synthetase (AMP-forming)/AMP-acid ligase II
MKSTVSRAVWSGVVFRKGSRVALHMANVPELAVAFCACFQIGAIAAPLNIRLKSAELRPLLQRLLPALYIGQADLYRHVAATDASIVPWNARFIVGDAVDDPWTQGWTRLLEDGDAGPVKAEPEADAPALLLTTSTTSQPKFVTHYQATLNAITESAKHLGLDGGQTAAIALPLAHGFGLFLFLACLRFGAPVVLLERFDPDAVLDAIERHRCTWLPGVPAMFGATTGTPTGTRAERALSAGLPVIGRCLPASATRAVSNTVRCPASQFLGFNGGSRLSHLRIGAGTGEPDCQRRGGSPDR